MSLNITFYKNNSLDAYQLGPALGKNANRLWLTNQDGEGGDFPADEIADVVYAALDKYFKEHY